REGEEPQLPPLVWANLHANGEGMAPFCLAHAPRLACRAHEVVVERVVRVDRGAARTGRGVIGGKAAGQDVARAADHADGEHPDRNREDDERGARLVGPEIARHLAPARAHGLPAETGSAARTSSIRSCPSLSRTSIVASDSAISRSK